MPPVASGEAIAKRFADDGVDVALCSREQERVDRVAEAIEESDREGRVLTVECDVRDAGAVDTFVEVVVDEFEDVGVLVNNAAGTFRCPFEELSQNAWRTIIDINLHGTFTCTQAAGRHMREAKRGAIINFSSIAAQRASPQTSHYAASKAGMESLTESLAAEWAEYGVRVNCIAPGLVATPPSGSAYNSKTAICRPARQLSVGSDTQRRSPTSLSSSPVPPCRT